MNPSAANTRLLALDRAVRRSPRSVRLRLRRVGVLAAAGRFSDAIADLDAACEMRPGSAEVAAHRGCVWAAWAASIDEETDRQVPGQEDDAESRARVCRVEALADLDRALALDPAAAWLKHHRGVVLYLLGRHAEAWGEFADAVGPASAADRSTWLAAAAIGAGWADEALDAARRAVLAAPGAAECHYWLGRALRLADDHALAVDAFSRALELSAGAPVYLSHRARSLQECGRTDEALRDATAAAAAAPEDAGVLELRADLYAAAGDEQAADQDTARRYVVTRGLPEEDVGMAKRKLIYLMLREHFGAAELDDLEVVERGFPLRVRADVQRALSTLGDREFKVRSFSGVGGTHYSRLDFASLARRPQHEMFETCAPSWEEVDIGEAKAVRCLTSGLWLMESGGTRMALLLAPPDPHGRGSEMRFQAALPRESGPLADRLFERIESAVKEARSYRGKILSFSGCESDYSGRVTGIAVHRIPRVGREELILPEATVELVERNVAGFLARRKRLRAMGLSTKKGLLFYGPPGTGKTHTIRHIATTVPGQTTLLVSADDIGRIGEYMTLARLLQPAIVVIEDADLIARDRESHSGPASESLLNRLLNEMDGLKPDADVMFILTTNRPEALEAALASRPGRVDQAIEFPLPDEGCRRRLARLYSGGLRIPEPALREIVLRTEGASASFVRELVRRAAQFLLERRSRGPLSARDVEAAAMEMVETGGSLNRKLLGA